MQRAHHSRVPHPDQLLPAQGGDWNDRLLTWMTEHVLASRAMFDAALILPLLALPLSTGIKVTLGVISGSWVQWWALPALQRSQVKADAKREAKAAADHQALVSIHHTLDEAVTLLRALAARGDAK